MIPTTWCCRNSYWKLWKVSESWRFVFELVIWPKEVTLVSRTQPSGPLCLWQCFIILSPRGCLLIGQTNLNSAPGFVLSPNWTPWSHMWRDLLTFLAPWSWSGVLPCALVLDVKWWPVTQSSTKNLDPGLLRISLILFRSTRRNDFLFLDLVSKQEIKKEILSPVTKNGISIQISLWKKSYIPF